MKDLKVEEATYFVMNTEVMKESLLNRVQRVHKLTPQTSSSDLPVDLCSSILKS